MIFECQFFCVGTNTFMIKRRILRCDNNWLHVLVQSIILKAPLILLDDYWGLELSLKY